jgi:hypothetical protein
VDLKAGEIRITDDVYVLDRPPPAVQAVLDAGGLVPFVKTRCSRLV